MSRFQFELASPEDDLQLRSVLRQTSMPGRVSLSLRREPSFFQALAVEGPEHQVIACRDRRSGHIVGLGTRSVRQRYVAGKICRVAYLGSLRLLPPFRSARLVARGYQFFKELAERAPVDWHFTSITDDNHAAVRLLTSGRAGLPIYRRVATCMTLVLTKRSLRALDAPVMVSSAPVELRKATTDDVPALVALLNRNNQRSNFALVHAIEDFQTELEWRSDGLFRDLSLDCIQTAWCVGKLVGSLGVWDQRRFKQIMVQSMPASWQWLRPIWNGLKGFHKQPQLVRVGEPLPSLMAAVVTCEESPQPTFQALLRQALQNLHQDEYLLLAVDVNHQLFGWLKRLAYMTYKSGIYLVGWDDDQLASYSATTPISLELGCL